MSTTYRVSRAGKVHAYRGKERLHDIWLSEPITLAARKTLRAQLDPLLVKAAWLVYGTRCNPAHVNSMLQYKALVTQVMADSYRLLPLVFHMVLQGNLKETSRKTLLKRLKGVLMGVGYQPPAFATHRGPGPSKARKDSEVNGFWEYGNFDPFTEAGWRSLCAAPVKLLRSLSTQSHLLRTFAPDFNQMHMYGGRVRDVADIRFLQRLREISSPPPARGRWGTPNERHSLSVDSAHQVRLAYRQAMDFSYVLRYQQMDIVKDWLQDVRPEVEKGTTWDTLVKTATVYRLEKSTLERADVESLKWTPPIEPFVSNDGLVVIPLTNGWELVEEGLQMSNCLRDTRRYAVDAVRGVSQVFRIQGPERATVEMVRRRVGAPWRFNQAELGENVPARSARMLKLVNAIGMKMEASWEHVV
ncbi:hypothetical protein LC612_36225 [Nostoc sp. CHAB 5834]|nr:hypothetical protein [Nostoc sp. CHAB 5834]